MTTPKRRSKGDGSIYEYRPGKFRAQLEITSEAGKRIRKTFTGASKSEVVKKLNEYKGLQQKGQLVADKKDTLNDYMDRWLAMKKTQVKATSYQGYEYIYDYHIKKELGNYKLQKITPALLNDYLTSRQTVAGLSGCSVKKHKALLHNVFKMALHEGILYSNPVERTTTIKVEKPEVRALTIEEAQELLSVARSFYEYYKDKEYKKWQLYQIYHIVYLALTTGLRRGELIALKWNCIDEINNTLTVRETIVEVKGGSRVDTPKTEDSLRTISIDPTLINHLKEIRLPKDDNSDYIFHTEQGKHLIPSNVNRAFTLLLEKTNVKCRLHDLRHTHATWLINKGLDIKTISERLGHSDITTTLNKYTHVIKEADQRAAATIVNLLDTKKENKKEQKPKV